MPKHGNASPSIGLFAEFAGAVVAGLPRDLDPALMQQWVEPAGRPDLRLLGTGRAGRPRRDDVRGARGRGHRAG